MKTIKNTFLFLSFILLITSCEDVIDINLDSIEPKIIIDGAIMDNSDSVVIKISKSTDYFEPGNYPAVSNAQVLLSDNSGNTTQLFETSPGIYTAAWQSIEGNEYTLEVESGTEMYMASVSMPSKVTIDSLTVEPTPDYMDFSGGYLINCHLKDPTGVDNYYRLKVYQTNTSPDEDKVLNLYDDAFVDGNEITMRWDEGQFFENDTVVVELQTLAESTYDYYRTLSMLFEGGMIGSANPSNPITNLSNGALGYFGAYTVCRDTIIISELF